MVSFLSHAWHLTDNQILDHFNAIFLKKDSWQLCSLRLPMDLSLVLALSKNGVKQRLIYIRKERLPILKSGTYSVLLTAPTASYNTQKIPSCPYKFL